MTRPESHPFVKFFSGVPGKPCSRFGTASPGMPNEIIGGRRIPIEDAKPDPVTGQVSSYRIEIDPEQVVAITADEWAAYEREYGRQLREGALKERTEAEFWAHVEAAKKAPAAAAAPADETNTLRTSKSSKASKADPPIA